MTKSVISVRRSTTLSELLNLFKDFHTFPLAPVIEKNNRLVGVVYFRNLVDLFRPHRLKILETVPFLDQEREDIFTADITAEMGRLLVVDDFMEAKYFTVEQDDSLNVAYNLMKLHSLERIPVVNKERQLVGMIGIFDIVLALFREQGID